jgi:hypothetical protein
MEPERLLHTSVPTGDLGVDAAIRGLGSLAGTDLAGRPAILEEVHDRLREILGELGGPGEPGELGGSAAPGGGRPRPGPPAGAWPRGPRA